MRLDLLVNNFTWDACMRKNITLFEQDARRCYIHVDDAVDAFIFTIENYDRMQGNAYNIGMQDGNLTKRQLAEVIAKYTECHIVVAEFAKDNDQRDYFIDVSKAGKLGWKSSRTIDDGVAQLLKLYSGIDVKSANVFADNWVI
jgi:nucleoside-diphosphate-sugar epimerase